MERIKDIIISITVLAMFSSILLIVIIAIKVQTKIPFFHISDYKADKLLSVLKTGIGLEMGSLK